jgi:hypothetical protein
MPLVDMPLEKLLEYQGKNPKPADHEAFWDQALVEMNQIEPCLTLVPKEMGVDFAECFELRFKGTRGGDVYAKYLRPKGAKNVYTSYAVTDKAPALGNNYYRLSEIDLDGRLYYHEIRMVNVSKKAGSLQSYYNGGQIISNVSNIPGAYQLSLVDMSGVTINKKDFKMNGSTAQVAFDAPPRMGSYLVILKGEGISETTRIAIQK